MNKVNDEDRKIRVSVMLTRRQRQLLKTQGGSHWLQALLEAGACSVRPSLTPMERVRKAHPRAFCQRRTDERWYVLVRKDDRPVVLGEPTGSATPNLAWKTAAVLIEES